MSSDTVLTTGANSGIGLATVKRIVEGDNVDPPETATDTMILDVMATADIPPGPVRGAVRALNKLDRTLAEVTARVHVNPPALRLK